MTYIRKHARFTVLDGIPADVWQEENPREYIAIIGEEPADFHGNFQACTYTAAEYRGEHIAVCADYLKTIKQAPKTTARRIISDYLRFWAGIEDPETAALLRADAIARG